VPWRCARGDRAHILVRIDQRGALREILFVQQTFDRHAHEAGIADIFIAIRKGETVRLREELRIGQRVRLQIARREPLQRRQNLQDRDTAGRRRRHRADLVAAIGAAHRRTFDGAIGA